MSRPFSELESRMSPEALMNSSAKKVLLDKIRLRMNGAISQGLRLDVHVATDVLLDQLLVSLEATILGKKHTEHTTYTQVPLSWWQHFKQTYFPQSLLKRFPVLTRSIKTTQITHYMVYPSMSPSSDRYGDKEIVYLMSNSPFQEYRHELQG